MKKQFVHLILFIFLFSSSVIAQPKNFITVKAGHTIKQSLSPGELYLYPQFPQGTAFLKNGKVATVPLNYNRFLDEVQFINTKGDTLSLNNAEDVQLISIGNDTLFYSNGFVKLVSTAGDVKLAMKQTLNLVSKEKVSDGYGSTSSTSAIDVYDSYADQVKNYNIRVMENMVLENRTQYYLGNEKNEFVL